MPGWKPSALREHSGAGGSRNFVSVLRCLNNIPAIRAEMDLLATQIPIAGVHLYPIAGTFSSLVDLRHRICVDKNLRLMPEESFCPQANEHCGGRTAVGRASDKHSERWG